MPEQALTGYKVLDLTRHIAGPYCTKLLCGLGAEVVKVEKPGEGDPSRSMGPFFNDHPHPEKSLHFLHLNIGKKSITLNLESAKGRRIFKELLQGVDILVENFSPRVMPGLGFDYEALATINPGLIMTSISNFGKTGPYRDYKALDITNLALSGAMWAILLEIH
jgi:crotonobetainyl-CoA:carnitine CoA-transferase CaiB-like acyl-CoA transferase